MYQQKSQRSLGRIPQIGQHRVNQDSGEVNNVIGNEELVCVPTEEEVREAIAQLKNNKAPGEDQITEDMLKLSGEPIVQWLTRLAHSIWQSEKVP